MQAKTTKRQYNTVLSQAKKSVPGFALVYGKFTRENHTSAKQQRTYHQLQPQPGLHCFAFGPCTAPGKRRRDQRLSVQQDDFFTGTSPVGQAIAIRRKNNIKNEKPATKRK